MYKISLTIESVHMVMDRLRHLPEQGESVVVGDYRFTVDRVSDKRIESVTVEPE